MAEARPGVLVGPAPARPRPGSARVWPAEVLRVVTFTAVVVVHAVAVGTPDGDVGAGALLLLLHATRESFFVLSAFVLVLRWRGAHLRVVPFWRRRLLMIGLPYLTWSVIYLAVDQWWAVGDVWSRLVGAAWPLLEGTAEYHLYFLLVSLQFALLLPLLRGLLAVTRGRHGALLAGSAAVQLALTALLHAASGAAGLPVGLAALVALAPSLAPTYQFWFVAGGVLAEHLSDVERFLDAHRRGVLLGALAAAVLAEGVYVTAVVGGVAPARADDVDQPVTVIWSAAAILAVWVGGRAWVRRRSEPGGVESTRTARWLRAASDRSFGIFLVHPLLLLLVTKVGQAALLRDTAPPVAVLVLVVVGLAGSAALIELARHSPLSLALTGRARLGGPATQET